MRCGCRAASELGSAAQQSQYGLPLGNGAGRTRRRHRHRARGGALLECGGHVCAREQPSQQVADERITSRGLFGSNTTVVPACPTEAYICAGCGYFEEYVKDVASIDWSKVSGATWHSEG